MSEFLFENFQFLVVKFSTYLNRRVFVMYNVNHTANMSKNFIEPLCTSSMAVKRPIDIKADQMCILWARPEEQLEEYNICHKKKKKKKKKNIRRFTQERLQLRIAAFERPCNKRR